MSSSAATSAAPVSSDSSSGSSSSLSSMSSGGGQAVFRMGDSNGPVFSIDGDDSGDGASVAPARESSSSTVVNSEERRAKGKEGKKKGKDSKDSKDKGKGKGKKSKDKGKSGKDKGKKGKNKKDKGKGKTAALDGKDPDKAKRKAKDKKDKKKAKAKAALVPSAPVASDGSSSASCSGGSGDGSVSSPPGYMAATMEPRYRGSDIPAGKGGGGRSNGDDGRDRPRHGRDRSDFGSSVSGDMIDYAPPLTKKQKFDIGLIVGKVVLIILKLMTVTGLLVSTTSQEAINSSSFFATLMLHWIVVIIAEIAVISTSFGSLTRLIRGRPDPLSSYILIGLGGRLMIMLFDIEILLIYFQLADGPTPVLVVVVDSLLVLFNIASAIYWVSPQGGGAQICNC